MKVGGYTYKISEDEFKLSLVNFSHQIQRFSCPSLFLWKQCQI